MKERFGIDMPAQAHHVHSQDAVASSSAGAPLAVTATVTATSVGASNQQPQQQQHHNNPLIQLLKSNKKKAKAVSSSSKSNPLLAHLQPTKNQAIIGLQNKPQQQAKTTTTTTTVATAVSSNNAGSKQAASKLTEIQAQLNTSYAAYSELKRQHSMALAPHAIAASSAASHNQQQQQQTSHENNQLKEQQQEQQRQIHVFITGLNTCPTYCHVCQKLIPLIVYASKCQLCSFTCHSTCSSSSSTSTAHNNNKASSKPNLAKQQQQQQATTTLAVYDPLKYCHINYLTNGVDYNNYIGKLIGVRSSSSSSSLTQQQQQQQLQTGALHRSANNNLIADYLFINVDNRWKRLWIVLRLDQPQLDLYQSRANHKPFDSIQLLNDQVTIETDMKRIRKLLAANGTGAAAGEDLVAIDLSADLNAEPSLAPTGAHDETNIYEELGAGCGNDHQQQQAMGKNQQQQQQLINFERSSLIILLYSVPKMCLQIGFTSFNKKNIWFDALQSAMLLGQSSSSSSSKQQQNSSSRLTAIAGSTKALNAGTSEALVASAQQQAAVSYFVAVVVST